MSAPRQPRRALIAGIAAIAATLTVVGTAAAQNFQVVPNLQNFAVQPAPLPATRTVEIQQGNGLRFLDAHEDQTRDWAAVTRDYQNNNSQRWVMTYVEPNVVRLMQVNTGRYLDAHEIGQMGFRVVTRPYQDNTTQLWRITNYGGGFYTLQQVSSGRYLNNSNSAPNDFPVYTSASMNEGEQNSTIWRL